MGTRGRLAMTLLGSGAEKEREGFPGKSNWTTRRNQDEKKKKKTLHILGPLLKEKRLRKSIRKQTRERRGR